MIEKIIQTMLSDSVRIRAVVGDNIWLSFVPGAAPRGPLIIVREIAREGTYSLQNEIETAEAIVQIDSYDETGTKSRKLDELIRLRLSGVIRETVSWLDDGQLRHDMVYTVLRESSRALAESPRDKSDRWKHRHSTDYRVWYNVDVPTHT